MPTISPTHIAGLSPQAKARLAGEFVLLGWLLVKGVDAPRWHARVGSDA